MGFIRRALVSILALGLGALIVANWRSQNELHRKLEALATSLTGRSIEPAAPTPSTSAPGEPGQLPADLVSSGVVPAAGSMPAESNRTTTPLGVIEPPDQLRIEAVLRDPRSGQTERLPVQPISGAYIVRPDGTVGLGIWGSVRVSGLTPEKAAEEIRRKLATFTQVNGKSTQPENLFVSVEVLANNSKAYYVVTDAGSGGQVMKFPLTGRETILDAIAQVPGLASRLDGKSIHVLRQRPEGGADQVLPVDWTAIIQRGDTRTNYQLMPGDRVTVTSGK